MSMRPEIKVLVNSVKELTLSEWQLFIEELSAALGINMDALNAIPSGPSSSASAAPSAETKKKMSLFITAVTAAQKIEAIKTVKTILNISLMDAKNMIEGVINSGKTKIKDGDQEELKILADSLTAIGASISIE